MSSSNETSGRFVFRQVDGRGADVIGAALNTLKQATGDEGESEVMS